MSPGTSYSHSGAPPPLSLFATAVANAELIRTSRIESQIDALMEMEFDDDYIQEDGKAFQKNLYGKKRHLHHYCRRRRFVPR